MQGIGPASTGVTLACICKGQHQSVLLEPRAEAITLTAQVDGHSPVPVVVDANVQDTQVYLLKTDKKGDITVDRPNAQMTLEILCTLDESKRAP